MRAAPAIFLTLLLLAAAVIFGDLAIELLNASLVASVP